MISSYPRAIEKDYFAAFLAGAFFATFLAGAFFAVDLAGAFLAGAFFVGISDPPFHSAVAERIFITIRLTT